MEDIHELQRIMAPAPAPQSLVWDGPRLWMGSRDTRKIYQIDPSTWTVVWEIPAPGIPWGITTMGPELRVVSGESPDDNRFIRRLLPGKGFDENYRLPCPDDCGSQLSYDGRCLHLSQWYPRKVLALGTDGQVERTISIPRGICGQVFVDGLIYLVTTDAEETNEYWLTRVDPRSEAPVAEDVARVPFQARALAFDGKNFWSNHRAQNQIVSFARPD